MFSTLMTWLKDRPIHSFFILTFSSAWTLWLTVGFLAPDDFVLGIIPGAWAPSLAAIWLTYLSAGRAGVRQLLGRLLRWRVGIQWYLVVLFGIALIAYAATGIQVLFGGTPTQLSLPGGAPDSTWPVVIPLVFLINIFAGGPLAEDIGWRGYILSKLRERMSTLQASLVIGVVWVIWHLPFYIVPEGRVAVGEVPLSWFAAMTIAWSVLFAWVYVNTESILMPVLFHAAVNTTLGTLGVLGQPGGDVMPLVLNTAFTWIAVGVVVAVFGSDLKKGTTSARTKPAPEAEQV